LVTCRYSCRNINPVICLDLRNSYNHGDIWDYSYTQDGRIESLSPFKIFPVGGFVREF